MKHEMSQLFSYWHVTISRPANLHCPQFRDSLVSRLYFRSILGAHCITEFKAKNRPPAVSTATSAPHEPNLHVVPVGFVEIGYKLTPCPLIPNLGIQWIRYRYVFYSRMEFSSDLLPIVVRNCPQSTPFAPEAKRWRVMIER